MEMIIHTLYITIAREFLQELSIKGLWLYVDNLSMARTPSCSRDCEQDCFIRTTRLLIEIYTRASPNVTLSWEKELQRSWWRLAMERSSLLFSVGNPRNLPQCKGCAIT